MPQGDNHQCLNSQRTPVCFVSILIYLSAIASPSRVLVVDSENSGVIVDNLAGVV